MREKIKKIVASYVAKRISKELAKRKIDELVREHERVCEFGRGGVL